MGHQGKTQQPKSDHTVGFQCKGVSQSNGQRRGSMGEVGKSKGREGEGGDSKGRGEKDQYPWQGVGG